MATAVFCTKKDCENNDGWKTCKLPQIMLAEYPHGYAADNNKPVLCSNYKKSDKK